MTINYYKKRPLGKFTISRFILHNDWRIMKDLMSRVVVVGCHMDFVSDCMCYTAFSDEFDDVEEGVEPPFYMCEMYRESDGSTHMTKFIKGK